jgi:hypothetical protein
MPVKRGVIPNMGDVSSATRVQLARVNGGGRRGARRTKRRARTAVRKGKRSRAKGGRKLKFGSPAWRKKYQKKKRR